MDTILDGQPFIPHYFGFDVDTNKKGAEDLEPSIKKIQFKESATAEGLIIKSAILYPYIELVKHYTIK